MNSTNASTRCGLSPGSWPLTNAMRRGRARRVLQAGVHAGVVVDLDGRELERAGALPERDDRHDRVAQVVEQARLIGHVAEQHDRIAVARLEHRGQRERLFKPAVGVAEHDVVPAAHRLDGKSLDGVREEGVAEVADDGPQQHRRGAAQSAGEGVRPIPEPSCRQDDALSRLCRDGDARRDVVEHPRDRALRDAGGGRDVAHRRDRHDPTTIGTARVGRLGRGIGRALSGLLRSHARSLAPGCGHTIAVATGTGFSKGLSPPRVERAGGRCRPAR